ncbi:phosphoribosylformylglycinamidine synthase-like [Clavelina lepadiformis]|uniref:phosphoribosylformylglycinamidine synthase-like n=1 Tax=Clavelina lepadiformis TaxID=159417 RepID=UPI004041AA93
MAILHFYQLNPHNCNEIQEKLESVVQQPVVQMDCETCYNVDIVDGKLTEGETNILIWILKNFCDESEVRYNQAYLEKSSDESTLLVEVGPRLSQKTPFNTNATCICHNIGLNVIDGIEASQRYFIKFGSMFNHEDEESIVNCLHDPMTQCRYYNPLKTLLAKTSAKPWHEIDVINGRSKALQIASEELGLAFDDWDIKFYANLFRHQIKKNPTSVECFDLAQSNSEHSRHWFFKAKMFVDGIEKPKSLFEMVSDTLENSNRNNVIAFSDNGSAIRGQKVEDINILHPGQASEICLLTKHKHLTLTAETHNFPTGVAPFPGAATGTGGRQRDQHAIGRGAAIVAGTAGYCVGNLNLPFYKLPWEDSGEWPLTQNLAPASKIIIEASNGASDYGNKFGEPVIAGFFRSFGMQLPGGERREWLKPIMFSAGIGTIEDSHVKKITLDKDTCGLLVGKIGGPAYRIGVGGGCASSLMHGENDASRDFNAVQRGDAEMQQKLNRVIRACTELGEDNCILSVHDQGAGGNGNVLKEIIEPSGAVIHSKAFTLGDKTLDALELWTAEYQESDAILMDSKSLSDLQSICARERCQLDIVGELNGSGRVILSEEDVDCDESKPAKLCKYDENKRHPVDLDLHLVLGKMPQKIYHLISIKKTLIPLNRMELDLHEALDRVLRLPSVASKRFLTNKVDRSVSGLVAQQQCVGSLHTPLADVAVTALSHFTFDGIATAIGEQPIKVLVDECAGARMTVGEALTNLVFAAISDIRDIKCSANWMWPAKLPGEGAKIHSACEAMCNIMKEIGIAVDGGKDSLSMAATVEKDIVKCPGALVISLYAPCTDIRCTLTPDLKCPEGGSSLVYVPMSNSKPVLGGSALAQCFKQLGDCVPDLDDTGLFVKAWNILQKLIKDKRILSGHDVSDGGFITCALEMAFAGNCGIDLDVKSNFSAAEYLFSERLGVLLEVTDLEGVINEFKSCGVQAICVGKTVSNPKISVSFNAEKLFDNKPTSILRDIWESTTFMLEKLQCNKECVDSERKWLLECDKDPQFHATFLDICPTVKDRNIKVAILREEGSNGDREMAAAFLTAGFQPWDVTMQDLIDGHVTLDRFRGLVFVGGFSYGDVFGSAKGWAASCLFNTKVRAQLWAFKERKDIFSLGVCNGCQLMALLGWIGEEKQGGNCNISGDYQPPLFLGQNDSKRFESRFVSVEIAPSNAIMFKDMQGSRLGVWVAHGEGKFCFSDDSLLEQVEANNLCPLRYVDHDGKVTTRYPLNPNGSAKGIAGMCSLDGRHLAVMPHPERCFQMWQWPWFPAAWKSRKNSPWLKMFQNALEWCQISTE